MAEDMGLILNLGRSHMPEQRFRAPQLLSLYSRALEPQLLSPSTTVPEIPASCRARALEQEKPPQ